MLNSECEIYIKHPRFYTSKEFMNICRTKFYCNRKWIKCKIDLRYEGNNGKYHLRDVSLVSLGKLVFSLIQ